MSKCPIEEYASVYYPDGTLIIKTNNEIEFNYIRLQITLQNLKGYYVCFKDKKYEITSYGTIPDWPSGLFDANERIISEILRQGLLKRNTK